MSGDRDFYEILGCSKEATPEELKKSYQSLILKHHPDKMNQEKTEVTEDCFHQIDTAYKTLRDPEVRKIYDAELMQKEFCEIPLIFATVHKKEFIRQEGTNQLIRSCRCGGIYIFPEEEQFPVGENILIACDECSLVIEVALD